MSSAPEGPRLAKIDPDALGLQIVERVLHQIARFRVVLAPGMSLHVDESGGGKVMTGVAQSVAELARWARDGVGNYSEIPRIIDWICEVLYPRPLDARPYRPPPFDDLDFHPDSEIGVVLVGAAARLLLAQDRSVGARDLAVLGSVSSRFVTQQMLQGAIPTRGSGLKDDPRVVTAANACRWLGKRSVPGFARGSNDRLRHLGT